MIDVNINCGDAFISSMRFVNKSTDVVMTLHHSSSNNDLFVGHLTALFSFFAFDDIE
jgi:hypothetical protein